MSVYRNLCSLINDLNVCENETHKNSIVPIFSQSNSKFEKCKYSNEIFTLWSNVTKKISNLECSKDIKLQRATSRNKKCQKL